MSDLTAEFKNGQLIRQTKELPIPLAMCGGMFKKSVREPVFKIQGLTGPEYYKVTEAERNGEKLRTVIAAVAGDNSKLAEAAKELAGQAENTTEYIKDKELVRFGLVEPDLSDTKVRNNFARDFPVLLSMLANEILELSGMGGVSKKKP
jgi:hypothetical protein